MKKAEGRVVTYLEDLRSLNPKLVVEKVKNQSKLHCMTTKRLRNWQDKVSLEVEKGGWSYENGTKNMKTG